MKCVLLNSSGEPAFWEHVRRDTPNYYFFIFDWRLNKDKTKIFLALLDREIVGSMLIYDQRIVHIRGSPEAAELLMNEVDLEKVEFQAPKEHEPIILQKYRPSTKQEMILMTLQGGEEQLCIKHPIVKLGSAEAEEIAALLGEEFPEWGEFTSDRIIERMREGALFLGIKEGGKVVSMSNTRILDFGSNIGMVVTMKGYRGRGYATSVVSALLKEIFRESKLALIHVLSDNPSAMRVYTKVGFKPYKTYAFIRGERIAEKIVEERKDQASPCGDH